MQKKQILLDLNHILQESDKTLTSAGQKVNVSPSDKQTHPLFRNPLKISQFSPPPTPFLPSLPSPFPSPPRGRDTKKVSTGLNKKYFPKISRKAETKQEYFKCSLCKHLKVNDCGSTNAIYCVHLASHMPFHRNKLAKKLNICCLCGKYSCGGSNCTKKFLRCNKKLSNGRFCKRKHHNFFCYSDQQRNDKNKTKNLGPEQSTIKIVEKSNQKNQQPIVINLVLPTNESFDLNDILKGVASMSLQGNISKANKQQKRQHT